MSIPINKEYFDDLIELRQAAAGNWDRLFDSSTAYNSK